MRIILSIGFIAAVSLVQVSARAADATPSNYTSLLSALKPGDSLKLAPGTYASGLNISGLNGTASQPITIEGPADAVIDGRECCNTVEIMNSSYVVIRGFTVDGKGLDGVFAVSAKDGASNLTHHITVEGLTIKGHAASQQTVGISTKTPTWGWIIRGNKILEAGTGLYLGNSDGASAFFDGIIENNVVVNPIGYCMQIKHQAVRPARTGQPTTDGRTIIRHNVFIKNDGPSEDGDRPNLLVGGPPPSGPGANDWTEIYGNFFYHNARESLFQGSGRLSLHDNIFVDAPGNTAILLQNHNGPVKNAFVYNNTIYSAANGIQFANAADSSDAVFGNLVFATTPITGTIAKKQDNLELQISDAPKYVKSPSTTLGSMDFYPLADKTTGSELPLPLVATDTASGVDFNGTAKTPPIHRGAYHGSGSNPGWALSATNKTTSGGSTTPDGGVSNPDGGVSNPDGGVVNPGADGSSNPAADTEESGGCSFNAASTHGGWAFVGLAVASALLARRRRDATKQGTTTR